MAANDIWSRLFGKGLIRSPEDYGRKGLPPTHPMLLDWMAVELRDNGWSRKELVRQIVRSRTYRQSSFQGERAAEIDPENRFLSHQNSFRLDAESIRDMRLAIAGTLVTSIGGPSEYLATSYLALQKPISRGEITATRREIDRLQSKLPEDERYLAEQMLHRRTLYLPRMRMRQLAVLETFDAANPFNSCFQRTAAAGPVQYVTMLNGDNTDFASHQLVQQQVRSGRTSVGLVDGLWKSIVGRPPNDEERQRIGQLYSELLEIYQNDRAACGELCGQADLDDRVSQAESAAAYGVARALLNLNEVTVRP